MVFRLILAHLQDDGDAARFTLGQVGADPFPEVVMVEAAQLAAAVAAKELTANRGGRQSAIAVVSGWLQRALDAQG